MTERFVRTDRPRTMLGPLGLLLAMVVSFAFVTPLVIDRMDGATTPARIGISVAVLAPLAILLSLFFGISTSFWAGGLAYLVAFLSMVAITSRRSASAAPVEPASERGPLSVGVS